MIFFVYFLRYGHVHKEYVAHYCDCGGEFDFAPWRHNTCNVGGVTAGQA